MSTFFIRYYRANFKFLPLFKQLNPMMKAGNSWKPIYNELLLQVKDKELDISHELSQKDNEIKELTRMNNM